MAAQPVMTPPTTITKPKTRRSLRAEIRGDEQTRIAELPRMQRRVKLHLQRTTRQTMPAAAKIDLSSKRARASQASSVAADGAATGPRLPLQEVARRTKVFPEVRSLQIRRRKMHPTQTLAKAVVGAAANGTVAANKTTLTKTNRTLTRPLKLETSHHRWVRAALLSSK